MRIGRRLRAFGSVLVAAIMMGLPVAVAVAVAPTAHAAVPNMIPLTLRNDSGRSGPVFVYVLGESLTTHRQGWVDAGGGFHEWSGGSVPPSPAPDVSIPGPANGQSVTIRIPKMSGRVYFSLGERIRFFLTPTGLVQPAPWNPSDSNRDILFDWSEFTLDDGGLWINSSQVDMFSVPHAVGVRNTAGTVRNTGNLVADGRNRVFNGLAAQGGDWARLVHTRSDGLRVRALAPGKGIAAGVFSATALDSYINRSWDAYRSATLTVAPFAAEPNTRFLGRTQGDSMVFTNTAGQTVATFAKPSTAEVFHCDGRLFAPNDRVVGPIARTLCAGLNRSTLDRISTQPSTDAGQFYRDAVTNHYSRIVHANMADGRAYGFPFDDVGGYESLVHDADPQTGFITLTSF